MTTVKRLFGRSWNGSDLLVGLTLLAGIGLAGVGSYYHFTIAAQVSAGQCDGCEPWHPLFVVGPFVLGLVLVLSSAYLRSQR